MNRPIHSSVSNRQLRRAAAVFGDTRTEAIEGVQRAAAECQRGHHRIFTPPNQQSDKGMLFFRIAASGQRAGR